MLFTDFVVNYKEFLWEIDLFGLLARQNKDKQFKKLDTRGS